MILKYQLNEIVTFESSKDWYKPGKKQYYDGKVLNMLNNTDDLKIPTLDSALKNINTALKKRITGDTSGNDDSSRSSALIMIKYFKNNVEIGRLNFIDLFGSEDISQAKDKGMYSYLIKNLKI